MSDYFGKETPKLGFGLMRLPRRGVAIDIEQTKKMVDMFLDAGLKAPSIAQYNGINSYSLSGHRMNVFSKDLNEFTGTFKTSTGNDIEDLLESVTSGVTTYLHCAYSNS